MSGTPSDAARSGSGVCAENGIDVERRSSAMSANEATGSSTLAMSNGSRSESARRAVSSRQPMFASRRSSRSGPMAALTSRTSSTSSSTGLHRDLALEHRRVVLLDHARAEGRDVGRRVLTPGPVGEVLGERDGGATRAAEELVERHAGLARRDVPERDLDPGERLVDQHLPVGAMRGTAKRGGLELGAHVVRVAPDEPLPELTADLNRVDRRSALSQPDDAVRRRHAHDRAADACNGSRRHQIGRLERRVRRPGLDAGDPAHRFILHDPRGRCRMELVFDRDRFEALARNGSRLTPEECAALARSAAELVDLAALERGGEGSFELLWRDEHSEALAQHVVGAAGHRLSRSRRLERRRLCARRNGARRGTHRWWPAPDRRLSSRRLVLIPGHGNPSHGPRGGRGDDPRVLAAAQRDRALRGGRRRVAPTLWSSGRHLAAKSWALRRAGCKRGFRALTERITHAAAAVTRAPGVG